MHTDVESKQDGKQILFKRTKDWKKTDTQIKLLVIMYKLKLTFRN